MHASLARPPPTGPEAAPAKALRPMWRVANWRATRNAPPGTMRRDEQLSPFGVRAQQVMRKMKDRTTSGCDEPRSDAAAGDRHRGFAQAGSSPRAPSRDNASRRQSVVVTQHALDGLLADLAALDDVEPEQSGRLEELHGFTDAARLDDAIDPALRIFDADRHAVLRR